MEASLLQGAGAGTAQDAPDLRASTDSRTTLPAHPPPFPHSEAPHIPGGRLSSGGVSWGGYSPFRGVDGADYDGSTSTVNQLSRKSRRSRSFANNASGILQTRVIWCGTMLPAASLNSN